jgi:hypothetical protein
MDVANIVVEDRNGSCICVACYFDEAIRAAKARGWNVGSRISGFSASSVTHHYHPNDIVSLFEGGWVGGYVNEENDDQYAMGIPTEGV